MIKEGNALSFLCKIKRSVLGLRSFPAPAILSVADVLLGNAA